MRALAAFLVALVLILGPASALPVPEVTSPTHPDQDAWYSEAAPAFEWEPVSSATGYSYALDASPDTDPDTESEGAAASAFFGSKMDGTFYFHVRAVKSTEAGSTAHFRINIDKTGPRPPNNLRFNSLPNGHVEIEWDPAEDALSGVHHYKIYRKNERDFDARYSTVVADNVTDAYYTDTDENMLQGRAYFYKIAAYDNAGNPGSVSPEGFAVTASRCDLEITPGIPVAVNSGTLELSVSSEGGTMHNAYLKIRLPGDVNTTTVVDRQDYVSAISGEYDLSGIENGTIEVFFTADDTILGDPCDMNFSVVYDTIKPAIELRSPESNEKLTGVYELRATAEDPGPEASGLDIVSFYYGDGDTWTKISDASRSGSTHTHDWNTAAVDNGRYHFKARATDKAGNYIEEETTITLENLERLRANANTALSSARAAQRAAKDAGIELRKNSISSDNFSRLMEWADSNYGFASSLFVREQYERAEETAGHALALYNDAEAAVSFSVYQSQGYVFNKEQLDSTFQTVGLVSALRPEAESLIRTNDVTRTLEVLEVTDLNATYYLASIKITLKNNDENNLTVQIIEVIPKDFANNASGIASDLNYEVISADPIIKFDVGRVAANRTATVSYSKSEPLSKDAADAMVSSSLINKFGSPPIVLNGSTAVDAASFVRGFELPDIFGAGIDFGSDSALLVIGAAVIIILLVIIALLVAVLFFMLSSRRGGRQTTLEIYK